MLKCNRKIQWVKVILLILFIVVIAGVPTTNLMASTTTSQKSLLNKTITYCEKLKKAEYTSKSWTSFQKELKKAKTVYGKKNSSTTYRLAKEALEQAKANLMFVPAKEKGTPLIFRELTVDQIVDEMGTGFNLGNTMDGGNELAWQGVITTKDYIKKMHDLGFNTIRIPVTYTNYIDDNNNYKISEVWISRVQDIVDYAISQDMYAIVNMHHDAVTGGWLNVGEEDIDPIYSKYEHEWRNIADRFKDYDEHLIFESMNEVGAENSTATKDTVVINNLNQIFVNVVRSTGSNNGKRWLLVPGCYTNIDYTTSKSVGFKVPKDTVKNRIFVSVHSYEWAFGLMDNMSTTTFGKNSANSLIKTLKVMYTNFTSKGIPVIVGEYGAAYKNNDVERAYYCEALTKACSKYGMVPCIWDVGSYDLSKEPADFSMTLVDRKTLKEVHPSLVEAILRGVNYPLTTDDSSEVVKNPAIKKITEVTLSEPSLTMTIGDSKYITAQIVPKDSNDTLQWVSSDDTVATVSRGHVRARGIGTTTLTVSSRSGSVIKAITVTVNARSSMKPCTSITIDKTSYSIEEDGYIYLKASLLPASTDDYVCYKSSDESVATVSSIGKVLGCNVGTATISITSSNGITKTVTVDVKEKSKKEAASKLSLALNVIYNDKSHGYYSNEVGKSITITENGQYTIVFDCSEDLSKSAKKAGVTSLTNLGAVYLKDYDVSTGKLYKSSLISCDIKYDKILVDGVAMTITKTEPKSAIKGSGIFDTNDPINGWDGCAVKEVDWIAKDRLVNFTNVKNPKRIEITFTISNLVFK